MNDATNGNGYSNGHTNGNGHNKGIFDLAPKQDPLLSTIVPQARRRVCTITTICEAARMFYCYLTDMSLLPGVNSRKGVVKFSDYDLAMRFKVSDKTIRNWKRALESTGEVWLTEKFMKNTFPQTVYNITAIVGQATLPLNSDSDDGSLPEDEIFSSNRRRRQSIQRDPSTGMFARRNRPPTPPTPEVSPEISQNQAENERSGIFLPPTTAIDCRPPRKKVSAHHGNELPTPTAMDCRGGRQMVSVDDGKRLPLSAANGFRGERKTVADNGKPLDRESGSQRGNGGKPTPRNEAVEAALADGDTAFGDWCESWEGAFRSKWEKELGRIKVKLQTSPSLFWQRRADFLRFKLDGGKPPTPAKPATVKAVRTTTGTNAPKPMPIEQRRELLAKAKAEAGL